jgi:N-acyl-D-aspartate/D-glutamate deacylase
MIARYPVDRSLEGKRLDEIAGLQAKEPVDAAADVLIKGDASIISFNMEDKDLDAFMRQPWTMTCTDGALVEFGVGSEHPRAYGAFPRKLRLYTLERGVISLEQMVHSSSGLTAAVFGIKDRGEIREGNYADILVFDPKAVKDISTYEQPHAYSTGMDTILVNGRIAVADGKVTEQRYGRVLLRTR